MCEIALSVASLAMGALGTAQQISATNAAARQQAEAAAQNQRIADQRADQTLLRAAQDQRDVIQHAQTHEQQARLDAARALSTRAATFAANGLLVTPGTSAADSLIQTREQAEHDAQTIRTAGERQVWDIGNRAEDDAWAQRLQATQSGNRATSALAQGQNRTTASAVSGSQSLLGGAATVSRKWKQSNKP